MGMAKYSNNNGLPIFMGMLKIATIMGVLKNSNNNGLQIFKAVLKMAIMGCQYLWAC